MRLKKFALSLFCFFVLGAVAFATEEEDSFGENFTSLRGHRFVEIRGAIPVFPMLTSHGAVQSFAIGVSDVFGSIFAGGEDYDSTVPKLATDINITFFPPIANYRFGFMAGVALDSWESSIKKNGVSTSETVSMNFYYAGFHVDYGHWVFSDIGTRMSIYGEVSFGWLQYHDDDDNKNSVCFDFCPFGLQFCPEKNIGIYFEFPHLGARPFFQTGVSIGL